MVSNKANKWYAKSSGKISTTIHNEESQKEPITIKYSNVKYNVWSQAKNTKIQKKSR